GCLRGDRGAARGFRVCGTPRRTTLSERVTALPWQEIPALLAGTRRSCSGECWRDQRAAAAAFQLADGGTRFLDEVANLPFAISATLLRVLLTLAIMLERQGCCVAKPAAERGVRRPEQEAFSGAAPRRSRPPRRALPPCPLQ